MRDLRMWALCHTQTHIHILVVCMSYVIAALDDWCVVCVSVSVYNVRVDNMRMTLLIMYDPPASIVQLFRQEQLEFVWNFSVKLQILDKRQSYGRA